MLGFAAVAFDPRRTGRLHFGVGYYECSDGTEVAYGLEQNGGAIDHAHEITVPSPTIGEVVITHPNLKRT